MNLTGAQKYVEAMTNATKQQMELDKQSLTNGLDAADRILLRKAADSVIQLSQVASTGENPT